MNIRWTYIVAVALVMCSLACKSGTNTAATVPGQPPFDLKGARMGMSVAEFRATHRMDHVQGVLMPTREAACSGDDVTGFGVRGDLVTLTPREVRAGIMICIPPLDWSLGNVKPRGISYQFFDGKLYLVMAGFDSKDYTEIRDALAVKFGNPSPTESNEYARYISVLNDGKTWTRGDDVLILMEHGPGRLEPAMFFFNKKLYEAALSRMKPSNPDL